MRFKNKKNAIMVVLALLLTGCGTNRTDGSGTLSVSLTDAPACGFDEVNVTVSQIRVHQSDAAGENDGGWSDIPLSPPRKINLTSLVNGVLEDLGQTALPAGHYTQVRLVLVPNSPTQPLNNSTVPVGGAETPLDTPSAVQTGIKLIHEFDVAADALVELVLDFDACRSVVRQGNGGFSLKPVVTVVPVDVSGKIVGVLDPTLLGDNPMVFAEQGGKVVKSTVPDATGNFTLFPLQQSSTAGNYDLVVTADDHATAMIQSVPVAAQGTTVISDGANPVGLNSSSTQIISGIVQPVSAEATLRALQTFASGPAMEIRSTSANLKESLPCRPRT